MKILAVVKFNDREAFVLDEGPDLKFTKHDAHTIVGTDGVFYECYAYERPSQYSKAFAGRKFTLKLDDGTEEHCDGQWWSGTTAKTREMLGDLVPATALDIESLKECYVFSGFDGIAKEIERLRSEYEGPVYGYWEFEKMLKAGWPAPSPEETSGGG